MKPRQPLYKTTGAKSGRLRNLREDLEDEENGPNLCLSIPERYFFNNESALKRDRERGNQMERTYTNRRYLDALAQHVLIFDGAMGTNLQTQNLTAQQFGGEHLVGCNDYLVISYPQAVEQVHRSFLEVGVDVIETCTFRSNRLTLGEYGLADQVIQINRAAAELARRLAD